jgi:cytochrome c peroxidase
MLKRCVPWALAATVLLLGAVAATAELTPKEELGKQLFFDKISSPSSMACAACHAPATGFTGPIPGINASGAVYPGAVPQRAGNRKPPSASYATLSPIFHFDGGEGLFIGGNFWDGRATGEHLGNPAADQALGPFLNPVEQNMPSKMAVLEEIEMSQYAGLWAEVWASPISYATQLDIDLNYDRVGLAIAAYEASSEVNQFSSKFDTFWSNAQNEGMDVTAITMANWMDYQGLGLDRNEVQGLALFNDEDKGKCSLCHVLESPEAGMPPLFTDFTFDNLGVPKNPDNPFYDMDEVYVNGMPINPAGENWIDPGLGGFLENHPNPAWADMAEENWGKHKVPTLRNVGKRPSEEFTKAYMHNGVFKSLKEVVHFYNTRDVESWPAPEVTMNVNDEELGDLGLSKKEETLIAVFMETLSDGYNPTPRNNKDKRNRSHKALMVSSDARVEPNPFNPTTTISYDVASPGPVAIVLYDAAGRRVQTVFAGFREPGAYSTTLDASNLPSGIYFVRYATADQVVVRKAVLMK